jgi:hypothetical protein
LTFAPTTMIRDAVTGRANTLKGQQGPGIGALIAPAEILSAKVLRGLHRSIEARLKAGQQIPFMSPQGAAQLAARLANTYQNSLYHALREQGGFEASIMKERIEAGKGAFRELGRSMPTVVSKTYGRTLGPLFKGFDALFDSIQEAPRFSAAKREVAAGSSIEEAVSIARNITGDTMRSGRVYYSRCRQQRRNCF